jgi:hypothetical protein
MSSLIGINGDLINKTKTPIVDFRIVVFPKMMVHPQTKEMVMVPMQDFQFQRQGSDEWFSTPMEQMEKHEFNPEDKTKPIEGL